MLAGLSIVINLWIFAQILNEKQAGVAMPTVLPGLDGTTPVQLTIEPNGMVHINASTMHDAFYAQGAVRPRALVQRERFCKYYCGNLNQCFSFIIYSKAVLYIYILEAPPCAQHTSALTKPLHYWHRALTCVHARSSAGVSSIGDSTSPAVADGIPTTCRVKKYIYILNYIR